MRFMFPVSVLLLCVACMGAGGCYSTAWYRGDGEMVQSKFDVAKCSLFLPKISLTEEGERTFMIDRLPNQSTSVYLLADSEEEWARALRSGAKITMRVQHPDGTFVEMSGYPGGRGSWSAVERYLMTPDSKRSVERRRVLGGGSLSGRAFEKIASKGPYVITFAVKPSQEEEKAEEVELRPVVVFNEFQRMWVP